MECVAPLHVKTLEQALRPPHKSFSFRTTTQARTPRVDLCHRPPRVWFITRTSAFSFVVYCFMDYSDVMASKVTKRVVTQPRKIFITRHGERVDFIDKTWKHTAQRYNPFRMTG
jgi:hypothetical protein